MEKWQPQFKSEAELKKQYDEANQVLETNLAPKSNDDDLWGLSIAEIKSKYPERYQIYLKILRAQKNEQEVDNTELSEINYWLQVLNNLDDYISSHQLDEEARVLRKRQFTVFEDIRNCLEQGKKEGYVKLPTGVGKTVLFSQVVEAMGVKTLIVVPSKILVTQTGEKLEEFTDVEFGSYYQEEKDLEKTVVTITYASLVRGVREGKINPNDYGALILDEAHKALGEKTQEVINQFECIKLGFTATPEYSNDKHVGDLLNNEIHAMSIVEAVKDGLICRFKAVLAETTVDLSGVSIISNGNYDAKELEKAVNVKSRNLSAVKLYKQAFVDESAIAYCSGVDHATDLAALFKENGIKAAVISGDMLKDERDAILEAFSQGDIQVLCNARLLIEGFDESRASVGLNLHPTLSRVDAEQRAGRLLRLDKKNPEKWAYIVDFIDENAESPAITFSEIAEASEVVPDKAVLNNNTALSSDEKSEPPRRDFSHIKIEGLEVVVDTQVVLSVAMDFTAQREAQNEQGKPWTYDELKQAVKEQGIKSSAQYHKEASRNGWPAHITLLRRYANFNWDEFLDRTTYEQLKQAVKEQGIKSSVQYEQQSSKNGWPTAGTLKRKYANFNWDDFLDREETTYEQLKRSVKEMGIKSGHQYRKLAPKNGWPSLNTLQRRYSDFNLDDFLDRAK